MNNQAAQTMPELPASRGYLSLYHSGGVAQVNGYTADQMHQYARDYAAALSQTAGVHDVLFDGYAVYQGMTDEARARINAGGVSDVLDSVVRLIRAQEAPAASGGEYFPGGDIGVGSYEQTEQYRRENPPAAASVSERARSASLKEIVPAEKRNYLDDNGNPRSIEDEAYAHGWNACRAATLRALEQALTQQRGDDVAPGDGHPWGDFSRKDLCELADRLTEDANLRVTRKWPFLKSPGAIANAIDSATRHYPLVGAIRNVLIETDQIYIVPNTPQPSADAVREVIGSMLNFADVADKCELTEGNAKVAIRAWASQLESQLSGGSHA